MPSEKVLEEKRKIVSALTERLKKSVSGVFVDYSGITVADDTKLRAELRKAGVQYTVKKNTLLRLAAREAGLTGLDDVFNGATAVATSETDFVAPAKILSKFAESKENYKIKAGFIEGRLLDPSGVAALAKLPPKEVLIAKVLGGFNAPISGFANVLCANLRGLVAALNAIKEKKSA